MPPIASPCVSSCVSSGESLGMGKGGGAQLERALNGFAPSATQGGRVGETPAGRRPKGAGSGHPQRGRARGTQGSPGGGRGTQGYPREPRRT